MSRLSKFNEEKETIEKIGSDIISLKRKKNGGKDEVIHRLFFEERVEQKPLIINDVNVQKVNYINLVIEQNKQKAIEDKLTQLELKRKDEPKQAFYKFSCVKDGFYATFFEALSKKDKEETSYTINELNGFITSHLRQKGVLQEGEVAKLENCYQPIIKDGTISKVEVLSEITIYDKFGKNVVGRENSDENKKFQMEKGILKGEVLTLLSTFANGKLSYDNKGEVVKDAYYYINEIANIYNIDREFLQAQNVAFSNELFKNNIESAMKHHKYIENCDWEKIKGINNIKGVSDTMFYTVNFGSNEINDEILKFLNRNKPFTKKYVHIELLEYANILDKPLSELSTKEEFEQLEKLKQIADKVKSLGIKVLCDDFQGDMYQKLQNMQEIFGENFSTIKVDAAISKKIMVYTSLQKLSLNDKNINDRETKENILVLLKDFQFMKFLKDEHNININDTEDFVRKLPQLRKLANDGVFEFVKVNYYNTFNINKEQYKDFVNSSNTIDSELVDSTQLLKKFGKIYGENIKPQNKINEITVEYIDTRDVSDLLKLFNKHLNETINHKDVNKDGIKRKVDYYEQGYLNAPNISIDTIKNHQKPKVEIQSHNLEDI